MMKYIFLVATLMLSLTVTAQVEETKTDSVEAEQKQLPKVSHAEPLFVDLMRDLGARKGEAEINVGFGVANHRKFNEYNGFVEYEWAPVNRLGLEVQLDYAFFQHGKSGGGYTLPQNRLEALQLAGQYTFFVSEEKQTSMAVGYVHAFEFNNFSAIGHGNHFFTGMRMTPIYVAATKWKQLNMLLYTGPVFENHFGSREWETGGTVNTSFLYVLPNSKNFIGFENNMDFGKDEFHYFIRPQMKLALAHNLAVGMVVGFPVSSNEEVSTEFTTRIIWEP